MMHATCLAKATSIRSTNHWLECHEYDDALREIAEPATGRTGEQFSGTLNKAPPCRAISGLIRVARIPWGAIAGSYDSRSSDAYGTDRTRRKPRRKGFDPRQKRKAARQRGESSCQLPPRNTLRPCEGPCGSSHGAFS